MIFRVFYSCERNTALFPFREEAERRKQQQIENERRQREEMEREQEAQRRKLIEQRHVSSVI